MGIGPILLQGEKQKEMRCHQVNYVLATIGKVEKRDKKESKLMFCDSRIVKLAKLS